MLLQVAPPTFWNAPSGSSELYIKLGLMILFGVVMVFALLKVPVTWRRPIVAICTFLAGLIYVVQYLYPRPIARGDADLPLNAVEGVAFWLDDAVNRLGDIANTLAGLLLGLGVFSLLSIHFKRLSRLQRDWGFSLVLVVSMVLMVIFGYGNWLSRQGPTGAILSTGQEHWTLVNYAQDFLFDGLLQQMDAAMFSLIAFYILSAAYRAFRIRSIEATILLATALIVILSLMGGVSFIWDSAINKVAGNDPGSVLQNASLTSIRSWIGDNIQIPSLRAIDFGIGIGALAMALRLWLSLEKGGIGA